MIIAPSCTSVIFTTMRFTSIVIVVVIELSRLCGSVMATVIASASAAAASSNSTSATTTAAIPSGRSTASQNLLLDSDIRDWVVVPLLVIMIAAGLLRHYVGILLRGKVTAIPKKKREAVIEQRARNLLQRCQYTFQTTGGHYLSSPKVQARQEYYSQKEQGLLRTMAEWCEEEAQTEEQENKGSDADSTQSNPMNMMMEGMKGNMFFMFQNMAMMQGIQHFFSGFILLKMPFPLTIGFKQMFQRGVDLTTLDTSYVSSVSWYFLVMYGLRDFFRLVIGDGSLEAQETAQLQRELGFPTPGAGGPPNQMDAPKLLRQEADNLELFPTFKSNLDQVEQRLLGSRYPKRTLTGPRQGDDGDFLYSMGGKKKKRV